MAVEVEMYVYIHYLANWTLTHYTHMIIKYLIPEP